MDLAAASRIVVAAVLLLCRFRSAAADVVAVAAAGTREQEGQIGRCKNIDSKPALRAAQTSCWAARARRSLRCRFHRTQPREVRLASAGCCRLRRCEECVVQESPSMIFLARWSFVCKTTRLFLLADQFVCLVSNFSKKSGVVVNHWNRRDEKNDFVSECLNMWRTVNAK